MHFSSLTLTAAVTASCLLSSGWSLPQPDSVRVRDSHQQGLTSARAELPSQTVLLGTATIHDGRQPRAVNTPNRFRVQKRENKGESGYNPIGDEELLNRVAENLMQQMASTQHPIRDVAVARCMAVRSSLLGSAARERSGGPRWQVLTPTSKGYIIQLMGSKEELTPALMLEYKAFCEAKGRIDGGEATLIPPPPNGKSAPESGPLLFAHHQLGKSAHFLQKHNPARLLRETPFMFWSNARRAKEARAAAMRPITQGINTLKKDMILEEKGL
ncbi:MAG: hypothetical protein M1826_002703 [Phylliscum demangeonii]|nr:MAG: hypothetical protein M1826_002703 [Phylliscum demangeonii]